MSVLYLPEKLEVGNEKYKINSDFRPCISILEIFERNDLSEHEKVQVMVGILYEDEIPDIDFLEAAEKAVWFLNCGADNSSSSGNGVDYGRIYSWDQDARFIIPAVDRVLGFSSRRSEHLHWWEFIGAFMEIGECTFTTLIHQRKLKKTGKQTKSDKEWWAENKGIAELKIEKQLTAEEQDALNIFNSLLNPNN